jgi:hypothetical protein
VIHLNEVVNVRKILKEIKDSMIDTLINLGLFVFFIILLFKDLAMRRKK